MPILKTLKVLLAFVATIYVLKQVRKPDRFAGRLFLWLMNLFHSRLTDWGLQHARIENHFTILDVGCGGGRTIQKLAALAADGKVYGMDYAAGSIAASRAKNANLIRTGRVAITRASVSQLPFPENTFDLITAVETQYYWPNPLKDMQEVLRVLKPGGTLVVIAETFNNAARTNLQGPVMKLLGSPAFSLDEHRNLFANAGYIGVAVFAEPRHGWFCGLGTKPSPLSAPGAAHE